MYGTCLPRAFAMMVNDDSTMILDEIKNLYDYDARYFHPQQIIDIAWELYLLPLVLIERDPVIWGDEKSPVTQLLLDNKQKDLRIENYIYDRQAIIISYNKQHAYYCKNNIIYDPNTGEPCKLAYSEMDIVLVKL